MMQIVIDIPEDVYKRTVFYREFRDLNDCVTTIKALEKATPLPEQQHCEDYISRADVLALAEKGTLVSNGNYKSVCKAINELPSVIPYGVTITDFADRCRECGRIKPCEDCISRQAVLDVINFEDKWLYDANSHNADTKIAFSAIKNKISELSSVTPTYDLEEYSTKLWKSAYERGKAEGEQRND